jgi:hypothetical protein
MLHGIMVREQFNKNPFLVKDSLYRNNVFNSSISLYTKLLMNIVIETETII